MGEITLRPMTPEDMEVSCIPDFYEVGDAKVTFAKVLSRGGTKAMPP